MRSRATHQLEDGHNGGGDGCHDLPLDESALYSAPDARWAELGLPWKQVADELWQLSSELNDRRRDHPISPSTLTMMAAKPRTWSAVTILASPCRGLAPIGGFAGAFKLLWAAMEAKRRPGSPRLAAAGRPARMHPESAHRLA